MSRMNELSIAIDELRNAAAALNSVADSLTQLFSGEEPAKEEPAPKPITKEEVRAELAAKSAEASRLLSEECRRLEEEAVSGAERQKAEALKASASRLSPRAESFSKELESYRYKLLKELLAV